MTKTYLPSDQGFLCQNFQGSHFGKQKEKSDAICAHFKIYEINLTPNMYLLLNSF
jgi:hypothetical protein